MNWILWLIIIAVIYLILNQFIYIWPPYKPSTPAVVVDPTPMSKLETFYEMNKDMDIDLEALTNCLYKTSTSTDEVL